MKKILTLFAMLLVASSMAVVQADYYVAHNGLLGGQEWSNNKEIMTSNGNGEYYRTYFAVPSSSTKIAFKVTNGTWTNPLGQAAKDNTKSDVTLSGSDNIEFTNSALQNITVWTNGTKVWVKVNDPIIKQHVLNGTKVMFYYGSPKSWGNNTMYFSASKKAPNADGAVYESGKSHEWKTNFYSAIGLFALNSSATYYLSNNNTWDGNGKSGLTAGCFADMNASATGNNNFVCTLGSTSYAITEGTASAGITSTVSGKSGLGLNYSLDHYYYSADGTTWNELPSDLSGLAVGTYTVKALATDGHIYMVSTNSATLTVSAYVPGAHDITATAATKWTYSNLPASETAGETVEFTVTPNAGYSVTVTSSDATITQNGNTYSFTMPDKDVAISVVATALSYNITYPASPEHYTLAAGNPTSGHTDEVINFTVTPDANYILTVTANGTELSGANNVYSLTMPAEAVTIAVTAQSLRAFDGSTPLYLNAAAIDWWCNDEAVQHATFVKEDNSEVVVIGVLEEGKIYAFTPEAGYYKSVKFSRHDPKNVSTDWGHTDYISLIGTEAHDYVTAFAQNASTATWSTFIPTPSYTFTAGTKIYYDFTAYKNGVDMYPGGNHTYYGNTSEVKEFELAADWKVNENTTLFQSEASSWQPVKCTTLPTAGQNMIVSTNGSTYSWGTYVPPVDPTVDFVSLGNTIALGQTIQFAATSTNIENPVYKFYVKKGSGDYSAAVTSFNFDAADTYTVKVEVDGDESKHKEATKEITVVDGAHVIYLVNHAGWAQVYAHMWGAEPGTEWPGDIMTLTTLVTEKNQYTVYAVTFTPNYTNIKFNNGFGLETGDLTLDYSKPYYYNGQWYATLDECDPITLTLSGLEDVYIKGDNATISATSNLSNVTLSYELKIDDGAFATLQDNPYTFTNEGSYTFKVTATGDEGSKTVTKTVNVYEPRTLYFVNKEGWEDVYLYNFTSASYKVWPGDEMTLTAATTEKHGYHVYSYNIPNGAFSKVIFHNNDGTQTADLTIDAEKPYFLTSGVDGESKYIGEWFATLEEIDPATYVEFDGVASTVLVNTPLTLSATSNVTNPSYNYYVKPAVGDYTAINSPHTFDAVGKYTLKVEVLENSVVAASRTKDIEVYTTHTFTAGTRIYVDFTAMTEGSKKVNYPFGNEPTEDPLDYDAEGAGTFKTIRFSENVTWSTLQDFIKTEKASWEGLKFTVPADGQNKIIVAADGASYTWGTYTPAIVQVKFFAPRDETSNWDHVYAHSWDAAGDITAWPGVEITDSKANLWYAYDVQLGANVLFHNNAGMQTANIENIQAAACYEPTAINYDADPKLVTVAANANCEIAYYIAGSKNLIKGEAEEGFDVNLPLDENNQIVFQNVEPGTYAFKINNGTWAWSIGGIDHMKAGDCASIAQEVGTGDLGFKIDTKQDVTVTYYPTTQEICLGAETVKADASVSVDDMTVYEDWTRTINVTKTGDGEDISFEILSGNEYISLVDGRITGVAEGTATVKVTLAETETYKGATDEFTVTVEPIANATFYLKNNWQGEATCDWTWKAMTAAYRLENVVYGGSGLNYNVFGDDDGAQWVDYAAIKYADNKVVAAYDTVNFVLNPSTGVITAESISKDVAVYTLAGSELALFSQGWAPTHLYKYTDMEKQSDGKYKWTNLDEKATLCKGPIEYKVIKDRAYENGSWPESGNFVLDVLRSGEYEIAIYFDPCSKTSWVDTTLVKEIDVRNLTLKGDDDWETGHPFTRSEYNDRASVTLSLTTSANPYKFKLYENGDNWYGDGQAFTRENPAIRDIVIPVGVQNPANMTLQVDKDGDYLFTYIFETKELVVSYPAEIPETKIAPLSGEFSIGPAATTGRMSNKIRFSRGNLQYNFDEQVWYTAENQYESLGDLNLRFGDNTYKGSVDLFDWSCTSSNFGLLASNVNNDYTGDFLDWGQKFSKDENNEYDWFTLSQPEWNHLLYSRTKDNKYLWSVMGLAVGPDTVNVFALFPDDWTAPSGVTINYGFYDVDDEAQLKENSFSKEKWEAMEEAGAVFLPLAGARAGWWGNMVGIDGETLVNSPMNPLANNSYCWVDGGEWYGYYWTSTIENSVNVKTAVMPAWHNNQMTAPQYWGRARRYGQSVRLVTRVPREPDYVRGGEEHPEELPAGQYGTICLPNGGELDGATIYELAYYDASASKIFLDEVLNGTMVAGTPYIFFPEGDEPKIEVYYTDAENADAGNYRGLWGSYVQTALPKDGQHYILYNNQYWEVNSVAYVGANRGYLKIREEGGEGYVPTTPLPKQNGRRRVSMGVNGKQTPTGFDELNASEAPAKMVINGRLFILRGEKMYDATGRLVK